VGQNKGKAKKLGQTIGTGRVAKRIDHHSKPNCTKKRESKKGLKFECTRETGVLKLAYSREEGGGRETRTRNGFSLQNKWVGKN